MRVATPVNSLFTADRNVYEEARRAWATVGADDESNEKNSRQARSRTSAGASGTDHARRRVSATDAECAAVRALLRIDRLVETS